MPQACYATFPDLIKTNETEREQYFKISTGELSFLLATLCLGLRKRLSCVVR